ncbi:phosphoenolpyruvate synthase [Rhodocaloribacter sp.]
MKKSPWIRWFEEVGIADVPVVGGKNASLGEMTRALAPKGIRVPQGFATTADAYRHFIKENGLDEKIRALLDKRSRGEATLEETGSAIRELIVHAPLPDDLAGAIREGYRDLGQRYHRRLVDVAVRSSATAEDLAQASFAGQQETYLNVRGVDDLLLACRKCYASLFTDRAIVYREEQGFDHMEVALSIGVQKMVRSDKAGSGVMFTLDTETGFRDVALINAAWGLGENVVKGAVDPDQYMVFKPLLGKNGYRPIIQKKTGEKAIKMIYSAKGHTVNVPTPERQRIRFVLSDDEILELARWAVLIEEHYGKPMDIEWAKDGETGDLFIVQARPETVQSQRKPGALKVYRLKQKGKRLLTGLSIGSAVATGKVIKVLSVDELDRVEPGSILVTEMTDPDWVPAMKKVAGIVTDHGGRTCHAAIVSRELGIPAVVGTGIATEVLRDGQEVTLSCAEGEEGYVYDGLLDYEVREIDPEKLPQTRTKIMLNLAEPDAALKWWVLRADGIGLARMEFIITNHIKIHPMALLRFDRVEDEEDRKQILQLTRGYRDKSAYFVERLARGVAKIAASQYPNRVIVRMSDFKTNEYANLIGGRAFEPVEENPMIGWRGASRYYSDAYKDGFALECRAIRKARDEMGLTNISVMIPFCRTPWEAERVLAVMAENGLERGKDGLEVYLMCEIPSNVVLAEEFARHVDGFSIGSNDLTQLTLGIDRDSDRLAYLFDERNEAVKRLIADVIRRAHVVGRHVGICGQAPSDYPDFAAFLVEAGIDSMSLNPDSFVTTKTRVAEMEQQLEKA